MVTRSPSDEIEYLAALLAIATPEELVRPAFIASIRSRLRDVAVRLRAPAAETAP